MSGQIRTEVDGRVLLITVDNVAKKNAFVPEMMRDSALALTAFDRERRAVGRGAHRRGRAHHGRTRHAEVLRPGRDAGRDARRRDRPVRAEAPHAQARDRRRAGAHAHDRDRDDARGRHRRRRGHGALLSDGVEARHRPARRRALPLPDPHRLGQRDVPPDAVRRVRRPARAADRAGAGGRAVREARRARHGARAADRAERAARAARHEGGRAAYIAAGEAAAIAAIPTVRDRVMSSRDAAEGIRSFVERREARFEGR